MEFAFKFNSLQEFNGTSNYKRYSIFKEKCVGKKVLDIGCAYGAGSFFISDVAEAVKGIDLYDEHIDYAQKTFQNDNIDFSVLDFNTEDITEKFEVIIASEVIEHLKLNISDSIEKLANLLEFDGILCLTFPIDDEQNQFSSPHRQFNLTIDKVVQVAQVFDLSVLRSELYIPKAGLIILKKNLSKNVIRVDIDGTICTWENDGHYENAQPIPENIDKINRLYNEENVIIYWTSRGVQTGLDWNELTYNQLNSWGCKFHKLEMQKPFYDLIICDKSKRIGELE